MKHTHRLVFLHGFVVSSAYLGPFRKLILRAGVAHVAFQFEDFASQAGLFSGVFGRRGRQFQVEEPYLTG